MKISSPERSEILLFERRENWEKIAEWKVNNWKEIKGINQKKEKGKKEEMNELMKKKMREENENYGWKITTKKNVKRY